jgi:hypothetical protein
MHDTDARDNAGTRRLALILIVRDQEPDLEEARLRIAQPVDALAGSEFFLFVLSGDAVLAAAFAQLGLERADLGAELPQTRVARLPRPRPAVSYASCC